VRGCIVTLPYSILIIKRLNISSNASAKLAEGLALKTDVTYTYSRSNNYLWYTPEDAYKNMPWDNPYDENGETVFINSNRRPDGTVWYGNRKMNLNDYHQSVLGSWTRQGCMDEVKSKLRSTCPTPSRITPSGWPTSTYGMPKKDATYSLPLICSSIFTQGKEKLTTGIGIQPPIVYFCLHKSLHEFAA
jgi:hypothetical protein